MSEQLPTGDEKNEVRVTRTALDNGGAAYRVELSPESEAVVSGGSALEGMTPNIWIASAITLRLLCLSQALVNMDAARGKETVN